MHRTTRGSGDRPPKATGPRPTAALTSQLRGGPHATPSVRPPLRPPHLRPHVTCSRGPACTPGGFVVISAGQPQPDHRRSSPHRTCGSPRPEPPVGRSRDRVPRHRPRLFHRRAMATAWRPPTEPRQLLFRRTRPSPWWWWHPAPFSEWQPVACGSVESGDAQTHWPTARIAM